MQAIRPALLPDGKLCRLSVRKQCRTDSLHNLSFRCRTDSHWLSFNVKGTKCAKSFLLPLRVYYTPIGGLTIDSFQTVLHSLVLGTQTVSVQGYGSIHRVHEKVKLYRKCRIANKGTANVSINIINLEQSASSADKQQLLQSGRNYPKIVYIPQRDIEAIYTAIC